MKYFTDQELRCRCCGQLPPFARENIEALVANVLDPLREVYGKPIHVTSGYRCLKHNTAVGGVKNSQHMIGQAADINTGGLNTYGLPLTEDERKSENFKLAKILAQQNNFDQMILYVNNATDLRPRFIHVSYKRIGTNRHCILKKIAGHTNYNVVPRID